MLLLCLRHNSKQNWRYFMDDIENIDDYENLENLTKKTANSLADTVALLETLTQAVAFDSQSGTIIYMALKNIKTSLENVRTCRKLISVPDK